MIRAYIVEHDIGFAPNPFFGVCTLAACKPRIRGSAEVGDWVVGIGSTADGIRGKLVYAMRVEEELTFDEYWSDERFQEKKPTFYGSLMQAQGDNIYHRGENGEWVQEPSRHTHPDADMTQKHIARDTDADAVLVSQTYVYFGRGAVAIPPDLKDANGAHLSLDGSGSPQGGLQREKNFDDPELEATFIGWLNKMDRWGYQGDPSEWAKTDSIQAMFKNETF